MVSVLVLGTGPIGAFYTYFLTCSGCRVTTVCRSNFEAINKNGIRLTSPYVGDQIVRPARVVQSTADSAGEEFDYILVTTKAFPGQNLLIADLESVVTPLKTTLVLIQNGIDIEEEYSAAFPETNLISCVVYLPSSQPSPGCMKQNGPDILELGQFPTAPLTESTLAFARLVREGGANVTAYSDVQPRRWKKALINACWNPIAALTLNLDSDFIESHPEAFDMCAQIMQEILAVARACGYTDLNQSDIAAQMDRATERAKNKKGIKMSMLADVECNRALEVEAILGSVVRRAKQVNIATPGLSILYLLANARDRARQKKSSSSLES